MLQATRPLPLSWRRSCTTLSPPATTSTTSPLLHHPEPCTPPQHGMQLHNQRLRAQHAARMAPLHAATAPAPAPSTSLPTTSTSAAQPADAFRRLVGLHVYRATDGAAVELTQQWGPNERVLAVWTRSLGCPFCQELAMQLARDVIPKLDAQGVRVLMVSIGTPERSKDFVARTGFPAERLFLDPDNSTYDALGFKRNVHDTFLNVSTPLSLLKRATEGKAGDLLKILDGWQPWMTPRGPYQALQQGGMLLFEGETLVFSHFDVATGVHAEIGEVMDLARTLASKADCGCEAAVPAASA